MKRYIALLIIIIIFVACGKTKEAPDTKSDPPADSGSILVNEVYQYSTAPINTLMTAVTMSRQK